MLCLLAEEVAKWLIDVGGIDTDNGFQNDVFRFTN